MPEALKRSHKATAGMRPILAFLAVLFAAADCCAQTFVSASLSEDDSELVLVRGDGGRTNAPKFEDQDKFAQPLVARDRRTVGWLALYPDRGASYSQGLDLVLLDQSNRFHHFQGDFGMLYGWCFADADTAVVFMYSFPHGSTPIGYDKRRIRDGRLLARKRLEPIPDSDDEAAVLLRRTPAWARCALAKARPE